MQESGFDLLRGSRSSVNGLQAFMGTYEATVEDAGIVRMQAAHVMLDGRVIMLGGMTPRSQYTDRRGSFDSSIASFAPLGREEAGRIRPNRLTFSTVREGDTWESIAKRTGNLIKPRSLAVLNDSAPETPPVPGRRIKVVVAAR
jgi:predicted Zn-dependent protease